MSSPAESANRSERIAQAILHYAALIAREQDPDRLLHLNAEMARDLVGADRCSIWLVDLKTGELYTKIAHGIGEIRVQENQGLVGACVKQGQPIIVNDTASDPRFLMSIDKSSGYRTDSLLVIPLRAADGSVVGVFQTLNKKGGFTALDADLLSLVGSYSAAAIEGQRLQREAEAARLLFREMEVARYVQQEMFPKKLPQVPGLDYAATCRAAKFIGGDYYDSLALPGGGLAFTLGDVSGKGIAAALVMAGIQSTLRGRLADATQSLTELLGDFNSTVYASTGEGRYTTLFCARFNSEDKRLNYVNCGHNPPMLFRAATSTVDRLDAGGFPLGLLPAAVYEQGSASLEPGDVLVCFSDGFSEATSLSGEMWEEASIAAAVREVVGRDAKQIADRLFTAADAFTAGADQSDDMTVVVLCSR